MSIYGNQRKRFPRNLGWPLLLSLLVLLPNSSRSSDRPESIPPTPLTAHATAIQARTRAMLEDWPWPDATWQKLTDAADRGRLLEAALLHMLQGDPAHLASAREKLLYFADRGGDLGRRALEADDAFFEQGQPWLGDIYYKIDLHPFLAYLWIYPALSKAQRARIEAGFLTSARFRMRAMTRWTHTANLMFKPTVMVAMAGLITGDPELLQWGFHRDENPSRGGYFPVLNSMLRDGGPWHEAPLYAVAHHDLALMLEMSRLLFLGDGMERFSRQVANGGSPRGLLEYYLDTAYPPEPLGEGRSQIRIATIGDGATGPPGDLFLVTPEFAKADLHRELTLAYALSADPRYAAFLKHLEDYRPALPDRPPLPDTAALPAAPSRLWPDFGLAMLRSVESPDYWQDPRAIAVSLILPQGYGHDHADKFAITLHGAGRLLYPDYNAVQYENLAKGWTRTSVAHNTLVVDGDDTRNVTPDAVRHEFGPQAKFIAVTASGVHEQVTQTRALFLTRDYLLDLFHAHSPVPRTYDYLLHSFGRPEPVAPRAYRSIDGLGGRYWALDATRQLETDGNWALDFVLDEPVARRQHQVRLGWWAEHRPKHSPPTPSPGWFQHQAAVRVTMAGERDTTVVHGETPHGLGMLVVRRAERPETLYTVVHEPLANGTPPRVTAVQVLARTNDAVLVRIQATGFTDHVALALGADGHQRHTLRADDGTTVAFRGHAYLRVDADGVAHAQSNWLGARFPGAVTSLTVNRTPISPKQRKGTWRFGETVTVETTSRSDPVPVELAVESEPEVIRLAARGQREVTLQLRNRGDRNISGKLTLELSPDLRLTTPLPALTDLGPGQTREFILTLIANRAQPGMHRIPLRFHGEDRATPVSLHGLRVAVEPTLEFIYRHPDPALFRIHAPGYVADLDMRTGALLGLSDGSDDQWITGEPLFTIGDGRQTIMDLNTGHAFTWPRRTPASVLAEAGHRLRWQSVAFYDRLMIRLDPDWTRVDPAEFRLIPEPGGEWEILEILGAPGQPIWQADGAKQLDAVKALKLSQRQQSGILCLQFIPATIVTISAGTPRFAIAPDGEQRWTLGPCVQQELANWIWR